MTTLIRKVSTAEELKQCLSIRFKVFVEGQQVLADKEQDGQDDKSDHYLIFVADQPAGTARVQHMAGFSKIGRVAVLPDYQGKGFGRKIMEFILCDLRSHGVEKIKLSSQTSVIHFYEKLGFSLCGEEYIEATIPHQDMQLEFFQDKKSTL
ncbi:MAG: family N-acetyltransferase [Gammaproteobacteria bacterium]|jgi:predicted GNAT family N-acyltransferase|nr:family N-acetyltransferase [Gammaproteobacteria bacterium]